LIWAIDRIAIIHEAIQRTMAGASVSKNLRHARRIVMMMVISIRCMTAAYIQIIEFPYRG